MFDELKSMMDPFGIISSFNSSKTIEFVDMGTSSCSESELLGKKERDVEDKYTKCFLIEMRVCDDYQQVTIGEICFTAHFVSDFVRDCGEFDEWMIEGDYDDESRCARTLSKVGAINFGTCHTTAYLNHIILHDQYKHHNVENSIIQIFDKMFQYFVREKPDLLFGTAYPNEPWVLQEADFICTEKQEHPLWVKFFDNKEE